VQADACESKRLSVHHTDTGTKSYTVAYAEE
jgi:hypothetical protein